MHPFGDKPCATMEEKMSVDYLLCSNPYASPNAFWWLKENRHQPNCQEARRKVAGRLMKG
jgi:hypothetical protein